jgi:hypothetical protein
MIATVVPAKRAKRALSRDPYRAMAILGRVAVTFFNNDRLGLWVPAFAGHDTGVTQPNLNDVLIGRTVAAWCGISWI